MTSRRAPRRGRRAAVAGWGLAMALLGSCNGDGTEPTARSDVAVVPDVVGLSELHARQVLRSAGMSVEVEVVPAGPACRTEPGLVCRQDPRLGRTVEPTSLVVIVVAARG